MNTYNITFNNGLKRTVYADSHLIIEPCFNMEVHWFILNNEVIYTLLDVKSVDKE